MNNNKKLWKTGNKRNIQQSNKVSQRLFHLYLNNIGLIQYLQLTQFEEHLRSGNFG